MESLRRAREERHVLGVAAAALVSVDEVPTLVPPPPDSLPSPRPHQGAPGDAAASVDAGIDSGGSEGGSPSAMLECSALLAVLRLALGVDPSLRNAAVGSVVFRSYC